jgi:phage gp46-like protein
MSKVEYAFPHTIEHLHPPLTAGMTLRDYFAAKAMQSLLLTVKREQDVNIISKAAYQMADDMLKAREK